MRHAGEHTWKVELIRDVYGTQFPVEDVGNMPRINLLAAVVQLRLCPRSLCRPDALIVRSDGIIQARRMRPRVPICVVSSIVVIAPGGRETADA